MEEEGRSSKRRRPVAAGVAVAAVAGLAAAAAWPFLRHALRR